MSAQEMVVVLFFISTGHCFEGLIADVSSTKETKEAFD